MHKEAVVLLTDCAYITSCEATTDGLASYSDAEDPADVTLQSSFALAEVLFSVTVGPSRRKFVRLTSASSKTDTFTSRNVETSSRSHYLQ